MYFLSQIYCRHCYAKKFGHRQKSDYKGWMDVKAIQGTEGDRSTCPRCSGKVRLSRSRPLGLGCSNSQISSMFKNFANLTLFEFVPHVSLGRKF